MASSVRRKIVGLDLVLAANSIGLGIMLAGTVAFAAEWWWVGVAVAVITSILVAAADRNRAGTWAMGAVFAVGIVGLLWTGVADVLPIGIVPVVMIGIGAGSALNRLLFGIVRPIPEARRRREQSEWQTDVLDRF